MQKCLIDICIEFESCLNFLTDKTEDKVYTVNKLFHDFMECFSSLKEEKIEYPQEFINDVHHYVDGNDSLIKKFEDVDMRYLMLSDFYDFCRITKRFKTL